MTNRLILPEKTYFDFPIATFKSELQPGPSHPLTGATAWGNLLLSLAMGAGLDGGDVENMTVLHDMHMRVEVSWPDKAPQPNSSPTVFGELDLGGNYAVLIAGSKNNGLGNGTPDGIQVGEWDYCDWNGEFGHFLQAVIPYAAAPRYDPYTGEGDFVDAHHEAYDQLPAQAEIDAKPALAAAARFADFAGRVLRDPPLPEHVTYRIGRE